MPSSVRFDERVVIVTGAGGGMGRSHATTFASRGARVVVNDIHDAAKVVAEIEAQGGEAVADEHDISTEDGARGLVATAVDTFGGVDTIVNNAGISVRCPFQDVSWELFDRTQKVNVYGPFFITKNAWPHLLESGSGRVVMVASKAAIFGGAENLASYGTSKSAILAMTRHLASEGAAHGIRVNAILPTAFTPMTTKAAGGLPATLIKNALLGRIARQLGVDLSDELQLADRSTSVVSSVVAWLSHPQCMSNGEFFNVMAGEAKRVSFALASGIYDPGLTVEDVRDQFSTIVDMTGASMLPAIWGSTADSEQLP